jgi:hypothetical protein
MFAEQQAAMWPQWAKEGLWGTRQKRELEIVAADSKHFEFYLQQNRRSWGYGAGNA